MFHVHPEQDDWVQPNRSGLRRLGGVRLGPTSYYVHGDENNASLTEIEVGLTQEISTCMF